MGPQGQKDMASGASSGSAEPRSWSAGLWVGQRGQEVGQRGFGWVHVAKKLVSGAQVGPRGQEVGQRGSRSGGSVGLRRAKKLVSGALGYYIFLLFYMGRNILYRIKYII